ncbi:hypothetical protein BDZ45DRAFT_594235 [Acephala macrosclerotiorum]|nr:hypothetical protein BDZ45DRAFT_594235 [Acephala macrosclerotiorum]
MYHVAEHFENGQTYEDLRPDFFVVEHMRENGLLSDEDFKFAMQITERPKCDGLVSADFKTPEMRKEEQRVKEETDKANKQVYNQRKEDRQRRKIGRR